jgi:hypothetical protein
MPPETGKVHLDRRIDPAGPPFYSTPCGEPTDRRFEAIEPLGSQIDGLDHFAPLRRIGLAMGRCDGTAPRVDVACPVEIETTYPLIAPQE